MAQRSSKVNKKNPASVELSSPVGEDCCPSPKRTYEDSLIIVEESPAKKVASGINSEEAYDLGHSKIVKVCCWRGQKRVDIRCYDEYNKPTTKGVSLTKTQLREIIDHLDEFLLDFSTLHKTGKARNKCISVGGGIYFTFSADYSCVSLRRYYTPKGSQTLTATKKGISFGYNKFCRLIEILRKLHEHLHSDIVSLMSCGECLPRAWSDW